MVVYHSNFESELHCDIFWQINDDMPVSNLDLKRLVSFCFFFWNPTKLEEYKPKIVWWNITNTWLCCCHLWWTARQQYVAECFIALKLTPNAYMCDPSQDWKSYLVKSTSNCQSLSQKLKFWVCLLLSKADWHTMCIWP